MTANVTNSNAALRSKYYTTMGTDLVHRALSDVRLLYVSLDAATLTAVNKNRESHRAPRRANLLSNIVHILPFWPFKITLMSFYDTYDTESNLFSASSRISSELRKRRSKVYSINKCEIQFQKIIIVITHFKLRHFVLLPSCSYS